MLADTLTITATNTSTRQRVSLLPSSAIQRAVVFIDNQNKAISWSQLLGIKTYSITFPKARYSEAYQTMLASESVLRKDWEQPEEDAAWAHL